jgi:hypothetical protein
MRLHSIDTEQVAVTFLASGWGEYLLSSVAPVPRRVARIDLCQPCLIARTPALPDDDDTNL